MVTPVMISNIHWGTYLFFAIVNACFIPVIYIFYPETKKRSLEEIDLIFAKGYLENISYVKASYDLPFLNDREVEVMAKKYGFADADEEFKAGDVDEKGEKETIESQGSDSEGVRAEQQIHVEQDGYFRND
jgi:hypothetical protein